MMSQYVRPSRLGFALLVLALVVPMARAESRSVHSTPPATHRSATAPGRPDSDTPDAAEPGNPVLGVVWIVVGVVLLLLLVWAAVRIGDAGHPADKNII